MIQGNGRAPHRERPAGTLVLIGGATSVHGEALATFVRLSRARAGGRIVVITTASSDPIRAGRLWRADFASAGVTDASYPTIRHREEACDDEVARSVREADGVFLGGGDQVKLVSAIGGTPVGNAIYEAYVRGAVVCGTSAGAAALTETTMAGGEIDYAGREVEMYIGPGLGLLGCGAVIDTHFAQRRRLHRLFVAVADYPSLMGLGIDEDTALVVRGATAEVVGAGGVTFVDGRTVAYDNASEITASRELTLSHLRVGLIGTGHHFDLERRELEVVLNGSARVARGADAPQGKAVVGER